MPQETFTIFDLTTKEFIESTDGWPPTTERIAAYNKGAADFQNGITDNPYTNARYPLFQCWASGWGRAKRTLSNK